MRTFFLNLCLVTALAFGGVSAQDEKPAPKDVKRPVRVKGDEFKYGEVFFNQKTREIRFAAEVIQDEAILEYAIVHVLTGKVHESLLATAIPPLDLQIVMKLLRYKASQRDIWPTYNEEGAIAKPMQDDGKGRVEFFITTAGADGKKKTFPLSDWVERRGLEEGEKSVTMPAKSFTYTGSGVYEGFFIAESEGALAAIYRYAGAMFNAFQASSDNDDVWFPKNGAVPAIGTKVDVILKPLPDTKPSAGWKNPPPPPKPEAKLESEKKPKTKTKSESK